MLRHGLFSAALFTLVSGLCTAQTRHWSQVPEIATASLPTFQRIFRDAHQIGTGITILGDSQETIPGGGGAVYVPVLGNEFYKHYGNIPKTGIAYGSSYDTGWLLAASNVSVGTRSQIFQGLFIGDFENSPSTLGYLGQVNIDAYTTPFFTPPTSGFFSGSPLAAELIVRAGPDCAEVFWRANLHEDDRRNYFGGELIGSGTTNLNLDRPQQEYLAIDLGTFDLGDHKALQIVARSGETDRTSDIVGVRFRNAANRAGVSVQSFSEGGVFTQLFNSRYSNSTTDLFKNLFKLITTDDVIAIQFGANDSSRRTADNFKEDLRTLITSIRQWSDDPDRPILLISDPDRGLLSVDQKAQYDMYPGVAAELALEYKNILALNTRRLAAENGWYVGSPQFSAFAPDTVHYSQLGAESLAQWQVAALLTLAEVGELGDCNFDGVMNFLDIAPFISILISGVYIEEADCNEDGYVNLLDINPFIETLSVFSIIR